MSQCDTVVELVAGLCVRFEGVYLRPYLCPAGVPTIGVGATFYEDGTPVTLRDPPITRERAMALLRWHIANIFLPKTVALCPGADTPERLAALVDFAYNLGVGRLQTSTLRRKVNAKDWEAASQQLMLWTKAGGRELPGLVSRRKAEVSMLSG